MRERHESHLGEHSCDIYSSKFFCGRYVFTRVSLTV